MMSGPTSLTMAAAAQYTKLTNGLPKHAITDDSGIRKKKARAPKRTVMSKSLYDKLSLGNGLGR